MDTVSDRTADVRGEPALGVAVKVPDPDEVQVVGSRGCELRDVDKRVDALPEVAEPDVEHDSRVVGNAEATAQTHTRVRWLVELLVQTLRPHDDPPAHIWRGARRDRVRHVLGRNDDRVAWLENCGEALLGSRARR